MTRRNRIRSMWAWSALAAALVVAPRALAVAGVGDTTVIVGDVTDAWKWPRELAQWTSLIQTTAQQIQRTDELIKIAGNPDRLMKTLVADSVPGLLAPVEEAMELETRQQALNLSKALYGVGKAATKTYKDVDRIDGNFQAFGERFERDPARYFHFAMQEGLYARYQQAVRNEETVAKKELKAQADALAQLSLARTETEIAVFNAKIAASRQRQDLAHQKAVQAKGELDAFRGELAMEDARKAEADREWAQAIVTRMRKKALAAYQAQFDAGLQTAGDAVN